MESPLRRKECVRLADFEDIDFEITMEVIFQVKIGPNIPDRPDFDLDSLTLGPEIDREN